MSVRVQLEGKKDVARALERLAGSGRDVRREVLASSLAIQQETKQRLRDYGSIDTGNARNSVIVEVTPSGLTGEIGSIAPYFPYIEFGAGPQVGGKRFFPPPDALEDWAKKHGFDSAWPICRAIWLRGLPQRPCLYPAFDNEEPKFLARIKKLYEKMK